jgi:hypothetical protein
MKNAYEISLLNYGTASTVPRKFVGVEREAIDLEASAIEQRLDSSLYVNWFASELCLSVTVLCCSAVLVARMRIEQGINLKFLVKPEGKKHSETLRQSLHWKTPNLPRTKKKRE